MIIQVANKLYSSTEIELRARVDIQENYTLQSLKSLSQQFWLSLVHNGTINHCFISGTSSITKHRYFFESARMCEQ